MLKNQSYRTILVKKRKKNREGGGRKRWMKNFEPKQQEKIPSCQYVKSNPKALEEAYWRIQRVYVYQHLLEKVWLKKVGIMIFKNISL